MSGLVYYALGGGHGHALRGLALLTRLGRGTLILPERLAPWARALAVDHRPVAGHGGAPAALLDELGAPELLLVDVFPRGVVKELPPLLGRAHARWLVTRNLEPDFYLHPAVRDTIDRRYERIVWTEDPPPALAALAPPATRIEPVLLAPEALERAQARRVLGLGEGDERPLVLAIGSGAVETQRRMARLVEKLAARLGLAWRFASHELEADGGVLPLFPLARYLAAADVAIAAGGYHAVHELRVARVPAVFVPQRRRHDDQRHRVRGERVARDPEQLEREVEGALRDGRARRDLGPDPAGAGGAHALAALVERRVQQRVFAEEEVAALARG